MLSLTRIFLHNWHRFNHHVIDVKDSLYLAGHNGSGKSSILDGLQVVLIADLVRIRFNSSAQERSLRNLDSYVRGKIGEGRYLRPGNTVAYIALEFTDTQNGSHCTLGVCMEAGKGKKSNRSYFILSKGLDPALFIPEGRPLSRRELKQFLRKRRWARTFDQVSEYQTEMLNRLGGLNPRFFDLFRRALSFQPIRNIREFVEQWLLEASLLDVETLQQVVNNLGLLRQRAKEVEERQNMLRTIVNQQAEVYRLHDLHAQYTILAARLRLRLAEQQVSSLQKQIEQQQEKIKRGKRELATAQAARSGAEADLLQAQLRLLQSDIIRRQKELQAQISDAKQEADEIRDRWQRLYRDLVQEGNALRVLLPIGEAPLEPAEREALAALTDGIATLSQNLPPPDALAGHLACTIPLLDAARKRLERTYVLLDEEVRSLRKEGQRLEQELAQLRQGTPRYPANVERLRELLTPVVGERPRLLCELLQIPDERWQNALEAMLGVRRFNVIVPPKYFEAALRVLNEARASKKLYDVGLVNLARVGKEGRRARPGSLAQQVTTRAKLLRPYLDSVLGDIISFQSVEDFHRHRRAVTPEVMLYQEWTVRALPPRRYRPWFIGERAQRSQIEQRERELAAIGEKLAELVPVVQRGEAQVRLLNRGRKLAILREQLSADLDERPLRELIANYEAELHSLDLSGVAALQQEVERLEAIKKQEEKQVRQLDRQLATWDSEQRALKRDLQGAHSQRSERVQQAKEVCARYPDAIQEAEALLEERRERKDLREAVRNAEMTARNFQTRARNEQDKLREQATTYNTRYQFSALAGNPHEARYATELERLTATELPVFRQQIEQAEREAEEELREHVLHKLREQIWGARQELERLNDALTRLEFHGERYRFRYYPAEDVRDFYDLLMGTQILGTDPLYDSKFYSDHEATFERFYELLTRTPQSEMERREQDRLTDYRRYLTYDIEVTHQDGKKSRLSRIIGQTSGGETQTPFYLAIAASFVQLYHINQRVRRPTIRLIAFDETFSKMDQDRIGSTLDLFHNFNLQIITATPLERCEYLVPKICTNLVLTGIDDSVLIEPYHNYEAQL